MNRIITSVALLAAVGTLMGCSNEETVSSSQIKTGGISAKIEVKSENGTSSLVTAKLNVGGPDGTAVILENGDKLTVTANGETKTLNAEEEGVYVTTLGTADADTEFVVGLERGDPDDSPAPNSVGKLPPPFTVPAIAQFSRTTEPVEIKWDPAGNDSIRIEIDGDCIKLQSDIETSDTGSYTIPAGTLESFESDKDKTCDITARVWRDRGGAPDSALDKDSRMTLSQFRTVKFQAAP